MANDNYHKDRIANRRLHPETLMMGYGYAPGLSEGSLKPPIFLTSTFVFENAQQGKDFFDLTSGRRQLRPGEKAGLVYSRFNNPNLEILEDRLAIWDQAERSAVFASGMAAISTTLFAFLRPGDTVLHSRPLYGGTETLLKNQMGSFGITAFGFTDGTDVAGMRTTAEDGARKGSGRADPRRDPGQSDQRLGRPRGLRRHCRRIGKAAGASSAGRGRQYDAWAYFPGTAEAWRGPLPVLTDQVCRWP